LSTRGYRWRTLRLSPERKAVGSTPAGRIKKGLEIGLFQPERLYARARARGSRSVFPRLSVSPVEAAQMLGCSRDFFDKHILGELRVVRRGRMIFIAVAEL
jgi:hypothetical protein